MNRICRFFSTMVTRTNPCILVIGCTGTGKSDLAVAIAKKFNGEVISADSMQIYKGLDIITNKITEAEQEGVEHYLLDFVDPFSSTYNVQKFREQGLEVIKTIREKGKIPIIAGGTTYYVESLLFDNHLIETAKGSVDNEKFAKMNNKELHDYLKSIDATSAEHVHPNNRARVQRAIDIFLLTGKPKSQHLEERNSSGNGYLKLRFKDTLVISLDASLEVLDKRLDVRVDKMKQLGLAKELTEFYDQNKDSLDKKEFGIMQCIGLKEFVPYLKLTTEERESRKGVKLFDLGCDQMKLHTRQYSRKQRNWVNSRLIVRRNNAENVPSLKKLDTSNKDTFIAQGLEYVDQWMNGADFYESLDKDVTSDADLNKLFRCDICSIELTGQTNWKKHIAGKKHKNNEKRLKSDATVTETLKRPLPEDENDETQSENKKLKQGN